MQKMIEMNPEISVFLKSAIKIQKKIDLQLSISTCTNLLIFGGGKHTELLLRFVDLADYTIRIVDNYKKGRIGKINIEKPSNEIYHWCDKVLISSFYQMKEIEEYCRKYISKEHIITLYSDSEKLPFYLGFIDMDAEIVCSEIRNEYDKADFHFIGPVKGNPQNYDASVEKDFFQKVVVDYFLKYIHKGMKVLDIGAGTGRLSIALSQAGADVTAVDISENMLTFLGGIDPKIKIMVSSGDCLPVSDNTIDAITSVDAIVHFKRWKDFLAEHARVLKVGGICIYNMYNDDHLLPISARPDVRSNYIKYSTDCYSTINRAELEIACAEIGNLELVEMIPYNFFCQTAFSYGILTRFESRDLGRFYNALCRNQEAANIIKRFENEIVSKLPADMAACNICVFRKV